MEKQKTDLQRSVDALEDAGFHVDRACEESNRDAGNSTVEFQQLKTGAICLRITPPHITVAEAHPQ
jgi:hypothetical protein